MALKATVYKANLDIADIDRSYYGTHPLTVALHPSENEERMMVRILAFALYANERLEFGRGLSTQDEPDLWQKDFTGAIELWIDVGLPDERDIRKACGRSRNVVVIAYGRNADPWWSQISGKAERLANLTVLKLSAENMKDLASLADRAMDLQCTIQDREVLLSAAGASVTMEPQVLQRSGSERSP